MAALVTNDRGAEEIDRIIEACVDGFRSRSTPHQERGFSFQGRGVAGAHVVVGIFELTGAPQPIEHEAVISSEGMGLPVPPGNS
jgi:hypothetical protein